MSASSKTIIHLLYSFCVIGVAFVSLSGFLPFFPTTTLSKSRLVNVIKHANTLATFSFEVSFDASVTPFVKGFNCGKSRSLCLLICEQMTAQ